MDHRRGIAHLYRIAGGFRHLRRLYEFGGKNSIPDLFSDVGCPNHHFNDDRIQNKLCTVQALSGYFYNFRDIDYFRCLFLIVAGTLNGTENGPLTEDCDYASC